MEKIENVNDELIKEIIELEWELFVSVENIGGELASCQKDKKTFYIMRYSQHSIFNNSVLSGYLNDLEKSKLQGRNIVAEKYAYMMEYTDNDYFQETLRGKLPAINEEKEKAIFAIYGMMVEFQKEFSEVYPNYSLRGRRAEGDTVGDVTFHTYLICELKTCSFDTVTMMREQLEQYKNKGENPILKIQERTVSFYGYSSISAVEKVLAGQKQLFYSNLC